MKVIKPQLIFAFKELNLRKIKGLMKNKPIVIDDRRLFDAETVKKHGFQYYGIGSITEISCARARQRFGRTR